MGMPTQNDKGEWLCDKCQRGFPTMAALGGQPVGPGLGRVVETVQPDDGGLASATLEWLEDEAGC